MQINQECLYQQNLLLNAKMERAFHVLSLSSLDLKEWLEKELEKNPILNVYSSSTEPFDFSKLEIKQTRFDYLKKEIALTFDNDEEKKIALEIAGSLDKNGFISLDENEKKAKKNILEKFQLIEPIGMASQNVQEALLIQLRDKKNELAHILIKNHYQLVLKNDLKKISKFLSVPIFEIKKVIYQEISKLNPYPGRFLEYEINLPLIADITFKKIQNSWSVEIANSILPSFEVDKRYINYIENKTLSRIDQLFFKKSVSDYKWLKRILSKRDAVLSQIAFYIIKHQSDYLEGFTSYPHPMTMRSISEAIGLSEATISRAVSNKVALTPRGLVQLRRLFSYSVKSSEGKASNLKAKGLILNLIKNEKKPLSDAILSKKLEKQGLICSRRTITKYRKELKIDSSFVRYRQKKYR